MPFCRERLIALLRDIYEKPLPFRARDQPCCFGGASLLSAALMGVACRACDKSERFPVSIEYSRVKCFTTGNQRKACERCAVHFENEKAPHVAELISCRVV